MRIGIIGIGVVGSAIKYGFEKLGHDIFVHDLRLKTKLEDVLESEVCFLCLPTPSSEDGTCDTSVVEDVVSRLRKMNYSGVVAIKSTVSPGTTQRLIEKHKWGSICFVPEFLRERCASIDFIENHDVCIIGTQEEWIYNKIMTAHGKYPKSFRRLTPTEAELSKYFNNIYNATLITFANSFFEVCEKVGANYTNVKNAITTREHIQDIYLDCNKNFRGFGGMCLPKDTKAIAALCRYENVNVDFFATLIEENAKYKTTVFDGMRKE
jgi:UDPglucose 6-dehydrogenase